MTLIVIHFNDLALIMLRLYKAAAVLSALMKVFSIPCHDRGHINVMLVLQSCTDPLRILPTSSSVTFPTSSDCTYDFGNIKFEEHIDIKEEEELNVKTEKVICSEEEECIDFSPIETAPLLQVNNFCCCYVFLVVVRRWDGHY